ncbi:transporter substrate-binding domain-containing protein [Maridesulfovibrio sp.]|uniref:transporter substrate-binding domain-containing protein n=1 Tax=Maridesulfovibrio sp. TaxID=2795000 RepID=UPI002A18D930|nr:transporter substrate-binding domain-containing protein [Maridesulfovibrio sp.]
MHAAYVACAAPVRVEGDFNYPPYEFLDNGIPSGFNIDIIRAIASVENFDIRIRLRQWNDVVKDLKTDQCDVVSGMFYTPERADRFDFSVPHNILSHSMFVRKDSPEFDLEDLAHKELIVERGDIMHDYALKYYPDAKIFPVASQEEALRLLSSGSHDVALLGKLPGLFKIDHRNLVNVKSMGPGFAFGDYCFVVQKGESRLLRQLNEGLSIIHQTGEYDRIYKKWFGHYEHKSAYRQFVKYAVMVLTPLLGFLVFFMFWIWLLRNRVRRKTCELLAELHERKRIEQEIRTVQSYMSSVIDSMPSVLIGVDRNCKVTHWNREAARVFEADQDQVRGLPLDIAAPHLANEVDRVMEALKTREKRIAPRMRRVSGGRTTYEEITVYPLMEENIDGAVIRIDDITERINLEQMIMQSEKMMSIGGLAAGMAHEINNPLAVIVGHAQNIRRRVSPEIRKNSDAAEECGVSIESLDKYFSSRGIYRMLDSIIESGNRAAKIVLNMLSFSRKSDNVLSKYDLAEVLDRTLELASSDYDLKKEYDFKRINIVREYGAGVPAVRCEGNEIQQVFLNLIRNGAEAMAEKKYGTDSPQFTMRINKDGEMVRIEIEDNGPGMSEDIRSRIFEPFYTTKDVGKGTGLGLSVSYFIITDHHKGTMKVDSMPGHWTRFTLRLPVKGEYDL